MTFKNLQVDLPVVKVETLEDRSATGRVRPWREKKMANELLSAAYEAVDIKKSERLRDCCTALRFWVDRETKQKKFSHGYFCRVRLCPVCSWRRSLKIHAQVRSILAAMAPQKYAYVLLTLTVKNCTGDQLSDQLDKLMLAWNRFSKYKTFSSAVKGWYRGMEVTHDVEPFLTKARYERSKTLYDQQGLQPGDPNPGYNTYHPHFHVLLAVNSSYFQKATYLTQEAWKNLWANAAQLGYEPQVDVRRVKGNTAAAVAEVAKYSVKDADYIIPDDWDLTTDTVRILDAALNNRRFAAFGGVMKDWHKKLNLDDVETGDLVHVDDENDKISADKHEVCFVWYSGYNQYVRE